MAIEYVCDPGGLDGFSYDLQAVNLHFGAPWIRGGVVSGSGAGVNPLGYVAKAGLVGTVKAGTYVLAAPDPANGKYELVVPADVDITHTTANASQPRTDLIIVEVNDVGTASSTKKVRLLSGTAGSGAPAPALPSSLGNGAAVAIASVNIPANNTTLGAITDLRTYADTAAVRKSAGGAFVSTTNFEAKQNIPHGLGVIPSEVTVSTGLTGNAAVDKVALVKVGVVDSFSIAIQLFRTDGIDNGLLPSNPVACYWTARV